MNDYGSYLGTRILLGCAEAGYIPGALYTMSTYYKTSETSLRTAIFFLGSLLSSATSALIGAGILTLSGRMGLAGWQWLFLIEGTITVCIGIAFALLLPPSVSNGSPLISFRKWSYFTERGTHILVNRVLCDDPSKVNGHVKINGKDILQVLSKPRMWVHLVISLTSIIPTSALQTYGPSIVKTMGFSAIQANALFSVAYFSAAVLGLILVVIADRTKRRGPVTILSCLWMVISYVCLMTQSYTSDKWRRYAALICASAINNVVHIINTSWLAINCLNPQERSLSMAMVVMSANAGALAGSQVFRTSDAPQYHVGYTVIMGLAVFLIVVSTCQMIWYKLSNHRILARNIATNTSPKSEEAEHVEAVRLWIW